MLYDISSFKPTSESGRIPVAWSDINWVYGSDNLENNHNDIGLPMGAITILAGSAGVGKTRACVSLLKDTIKYNKAKILFFQLEMPISQFYSKYIGQDSHPHDSENYFYMSDSSELSEQMEEIDFIKPNIIVVDSVNKIEGFNNGYGTDDIRDCFSEKSTKYNAHVIFLAHLNNSNNIKGGTNLPHMGDIVIKMTKAKDSKDKYISMLPNSVVFKVDKTRFGPSDRMAILQHNNEGVNCITANYMQPHNEENILKIDDGNGNICCVPLSEAIEAELNRKKQLSESYWSDAELEENMNNAFDKMVENGVQETDNRDMMQKFASLITGVYPK